MTHAFATRCFCERRRRWKIEARIARTPFSKCADTSPLAAPSPRSANKHFQSLDFFRLRKE